MRWYLSLCPEGEYRVMNVTGELPAVSFGLTQKCPVMVLAVSGDGGGLTYGMVNFLRPDAKDRKGPAVDQMPLGFVCCSGQPLLSGSLIQHGTWDGRTTYPATSSWDHIVEGRPEAYAKHSIVPAASAGSIRDLKGTSHEGAFTTLISGLSEKVHGDARMILDATEGPGDSTPSGEKYNR
jgi:hypothetical protein